MQVEVCGGRGTAVGQGSGMSIAALKQTNPCHFCNQSGHWNLECRLNSNRVTLENQLCDEMQAPFNQMQVPNDQLQMANKQMQRPQTVNMPQIQMIPQAPIMPQAQTMPWAPVMAQAPIQRGVSVPRFNNNQNRRFQQNLYPSLNAT